MLSSFVAINPEWLNISEEDIYSSDARRQLNSQLTVIGLDVRVAPEDSLGQITSAGTKTSTTPGSRGNASLIRFLI